MPPFRRVFLWRVSPELKDSQKSTPPEIVNSDVEKMRLLRGKYEVILNIPAGQKVPAENSGDIPEAIIASPSTVNISFLEKQGGVIL